MGFLDSLDRVYRGFQTLIDDDESTDGGVRGTQVDDMGVRTAATAGNLAASLIPGAVIDLARLAPGVELKGGLWDNFGMKDTAARAGDLLVGEGTLTGWTIRKTGEAFDVAYREGIENPIETAIYAAGGAESWAKAYELAQQRSLMGTAMLAMGAQRRWANRNLFEGAGDVALGAMRALPGGAGQVLAVGSAGAENVDWLKSGERDASGLIPGADGTTKGGAWDEFKEINPSARWIAGSLDTGVMFVADPAMIALKGAGAARHARRATDAFRQSRWDDLFGKLEDTGKVTGRRNMDGELVEALPEKNFKPGFLDDLKSEAEVMAALNLRRNHYAGPLIARLLYKTNNIADPVMRVNARRAIAGVVHGDQQAMLDLPKYSEALGYKMSNAMRGSSGLHGFDATAADIEKAASGALRSHLEPDAVAGVRANLESESDFMDLVASIAKPAVRRETTIDRAARKVYGSEGDETIFDVTASGKRALARERGQGLGRDGSLHTGHDRLDRVFSKVPGSSVFWSDPWTPGAMIIRGGFKEVTKADVAHVIGGAAGFTAGVQPIAKGLARASDALRSPRVYGVLNVEDAQLSVGVAHHIARVGGLAPERAQARIDSVIHAQSAATRADAIRELQEEAIQTLAKRYGVNEQAAMDVARGGLNYTRSMVTVKNAQAFSAQRSSLHPQRMADGRLVDPTRTADAVLPDGDGVMVFVGGKPGAHPITNTQTVNSVEIMDLERAKKWLRRDYHFNAYARYRLHRTPGNENPLRRQQAEAGLAHPILDLAEDNHLLSLGEQLERTNSFWKRAVLISRAGSYALRNTLEEQLRVWALGYASVAASQRHEASKYLTKTGKVKPIPDDLSAAIAAQEEELAGLTELLDDADLLRHVKAYETKVARTHPTQRDALRVNPEYAKYQTMLEHKTEAAENLARLRKIADEHRPFAKRDVGHRLSDGTVVEWDQAYAGSGRASFDLQRAGGSGFDVNDRDQDLVRQALRTRDRLASEGAHLSIKQGAEPEEVAYFFDEYEHILNNQIGQDAAGRVALAARAEGLSGDDVVRKVQSWLDSGTPEARRYLSANPVYRFDTETWAHDIADFVEGVTPRSELAAQALAGPVDSASLARMFEGQLGDTPLLHRASGSLLMGMQGRITQMTVGRMFRKLDEMSLQRWTRHPMFSAFYEDAMARRVESWHRYVVQTRGKDAVIGSDEMEALASAARREAHHNIKQTFYDATVRSSAAHQLRFIYPFFAAHQDSVRFWGRVIGEDPSVLRKLQIGFQAPSNMGLVIDEKGNPVPQGSPVDPLHHSVVAQLPDFLGGRFDMPLNSMMLMLQSGSILNPGAGPMVSIPVSHFQVHWAAHDPEVERALKFFQPWGAPKEDGLWQALPTPAKRVRDLWESHISQDSQGYQDLLTMRLVDAHVKYRNEHDGAQPSKAEWERIEAREAAKIRGGAWMRLMASLVSPSQPQPISEFHGLLAEYRRLADYGRANKMGPFWAVNKFIEDHGDTYYALTQSKSGMRGNVPPTTRAMKVLEDNKRLRNQVSIDAWGLLVGPEGGKDGGAFSTNAYRAMQKVALKRGGGKIAGGISNEDFFTKVKVGEGWQEYNRLLLDAQQDSLDRGYALPDDDPEYTAAKKAITRQVAEGNEVWFAHRYDTKVSFDELLSDARTIASDKALVRDPGRSDIRFLAAYLEARDFVTDLLAARQAAGYAGSIEAEQNADIRLALARYTAMLATENIGFQEYVMPNFVNRDPFYDEDLLGGADQ